MIKINGKEYSDRHGGPFDRGEADSYYRRGKDPHYFEGSTGSSPRVELYPGDEKYDEYIAGFEYNELMKDFKL